VKWFRRTRPGRPLRRRFADLQAMPEPARRLALAGEEAVGWIEAAARHGLIEAQLLFGQALLDRGEAAQALSWFRVAASTGHAPALNMVGRCYEKGWGMPADPASAAAHYRRAAEQGHDWALFNLANLFLYGLGVARDRRQAYDLYRSAAQLGHAKAMNMLGRAHEEGWAGSRDMAQAAVWYERAARAGDFRGQFNHAVLLAEHGRRDEALDWFERAFAGGSPDFLVQAGRMLRASGDPVLQAAPDRVRRRSLPPAPAPRRR